MSMVIREADNSTSISNEEALSFFHLLDAFSLNGQELLQMETLGETVWCALLRHLRYLIVISGL